MMWLWPWPDEEFSRRHSGATDDPDTRIALDVVGRLCEDARLRGQQVTVEVQNRVLILTGTVGSPDTRNAVVASARGVAGIREVCDMLRVSGSPHAGDEEVFDRIVGGLTTETSGASTPGAPAKDRRVLLALLAWGLLSLLTAMLGLAAAAAVAIIAGIVLTLAVRHGHMPHQPPKDGPAMPR